mgnify:CR=1 FL=1|tara:strand:- start:480 stop:1364 length:885 start_codon:yes stop_codon:yes gene_type:complete
MNKIVERDFIIGDEWVYFKLYTGYSLSDSILIRDISTLVKKLKDMGIIRKWFFIRYADPDYHLRLRLLVKKKEYIGTVINEMNEKFKWHFNQGVIWKYQMDSYERELTRYGEETIDLTETLFNHDSELCLNILNILNSYNSEDLRWLIALRCIDYYLDSFGVTESNKIKFVEAAKNSLNKVYSKTSKSLTPQLNRKYKEERKKINDIFDDFAYDGELIISLHEIFNENKIKNITHEIIIKNGNNNTEISSYIHMCLNRLFKTRNTFNEYVCYDLLFRFYMEKKYTENKIERNKK